MTAAKKAAAAPTADADSAEESKPAKGNGTTHTVVAQLIQVQVGEQVLQFSVGDVLPTLDADEVERLTDLGLIAESE